MSQQPPEDSVQPEPLEESLQLPDEELVFPQLKAGEAWGHSITKKRATELQALLQQWEMEKEHGERKGPFDGGPGRFGTGLSGACVFWFIARTKTPQSGVAEVDESVLRFVSVQLIERSMTNLGDVHLEGAYLGAAHLKGAHLPGVHLERADISGWRRGGASVNEGAELEFSAHLEGANLTGAHLDGAYLNCAFLDGADLTGAHLEGANLSDASLQRTNLRLAFLNNATSLNNMVLDNTSVADVRWGDTNLAVVDWTRASRGFLGLGQHLEAIELGDESDARRKSGFWDIPKNKYQWLLGFKDAVRANRQLATVLRQQRLNEDADRFAYKAQKLQREVLRRQRSVGAYLFSLLLAVLAGYGYRLGRILIVYGLAVLLFAAGYFLAGSVTAQAHLSLQQQALDALQVSLNAIHGRVFFTSLGLDTLQSWLATLESIVGIVIEGVFVAMLIQRFFAR